MTIVQQTLFQQELVQQIPYVSTDLRMIELTARDARRQDMIIEGTSYRRLDAQYFAWIERRIELARKAAKDGKIKGDALQALITRYQAVKDWVDENIDLKYLTAARKLFESASYTPPPAALPKPKVVIEPEPVRSYRYPDDGHWEYTVPIDPDVVKIIDSIRDEALSKGWTEASLYQNRGHFIAGKWYGLICILDKTDQIEKIDKEIIYIRTFKGSAVPLEGEIVKFPNLNIDVHDE